MNFVDIYYFNEMCEECKFKKLRLSELVTEDYNYPKGEKRTYFLYCENEKVCEMWQGIVGTYKTLLKDKR